MLLAILKLKFKMIKKNTIFNKEYTFTICVGRVWIVIIYFFIEKQTFNGLFKAIGIERLFHHL